MQVDRRLPQCVEMEQVVLGTMLISEAACDIAIERLQEEDFYNGSHKRIFEKIRGIVANGKRVDLEILNGLISDTADNAALFNLPEHVATASNMPYYCDQVVDKSMRRRLIRASQEVAQMAYEDEETQEVLERSERAIIEATMRARSTDIKSAEQIMGVTLAEMDRLHAGGKFGVTSGFPEIDEKIGGFDAGEFIVCGGRPSSGKSALGLVMSLKQAMIHGIPVAYFSIEMPDKSIGQRFLSMETQIGLFGIRIGRVNRDNLQRIALTSNEISKIPFYLDDSPSLSADRFRSVLRRMKSQYNVQIAYIDHVGLMQLPKGGKRYEEFSKLSGDIKRIARQMKIPVMGMCQLNRESVKRKNKKNHRPILADLRETGSFEQDADMVIFVHREFLHTKDDADKYTAEIIVEKQRNGPIGDVRIGWDGECSRFYSGDGLSGVF
jgi:replicative DNA helicase